MSELIWALALGRSSGEHALSVDPDIDKLTQEAWLAGYDAATGVVKVILTQGEPE